MRIIQQIHSLRAALICRMNELVLRWVTFETWTYTAMLPSAAGGSSGNQTGAADPLLGCVVKNPRHQELLLLFDGLDTVADVYVGGRLVLQARNFHRWVFHACSLFDALLLYAVCSVLLKPKQAILQFYSLEAPDAESGSRTELLCLEPSGSPLQDPDPDSDPDIEPSGSPLQVSQFLTLRTQTQIRRMNGCTCTVLQPYCNSIVTELYCTAGSTQLM